MTNAEIDYINGILDKLEFDAQAMTAQVAAVTAELKTINDNLSALVELMKQAPVMRAQVRTDVPLIRG